MSETASPAAIPVAAIPAGAQSGTAGSDKILKTIKSAPKEVDSSSELDQLEVAEVKSDLKMRRWIGYGAAALALGQLVTADLVFVMYAWHGKHWDLPTEAIAAWLTSTVVQVVAVVLVVTKYLFPSAGRKPRS